MARFAIAAASLGVAALLAGCTSLPMPTASKSRALDYLDDDIGGLLLAFDMPAALEPAPKGSTLTFEAVSAGSGTRRVVAVLVPAEADETAGQLRPPSADRTYYLFAIQQSDRAAIRAAQDWARGQPAGGTTFNVALEPRFCAAETLDPVRVRFSVLVALPGATSLEPLIESRLLADALKASGVSSIAPCPGHSG